MDTMPVLVTFRRFTRSDVLDARVRERACWLQQLHPGLTMCRVLVAMPHRHQPAGGRLRIRIELRLPDREPVAVTSTFDRDAALDDFEARMLDTESQVDLLQRHAQAAIRRAFEVAHQRLEEPAAARFPAPRV